jgi:hypothetical protein
MDSGPTTSSWPIVSASIFLSSALALSASTFALSALIERSSQENGLAVAHGVHLINRGLPSLFGILRVMPGLLITVENKGAGNPRAVT